MVIGVEGNVHVGKTTFINELLKKQKYLVIKEIPFLKESGDYERQEYYINEECNRKKLINKAKNIILDRTIISTLIYTFNSNKFSKKEIKDIKEKIINAVLDSKIIIPDKIYFIIYPYDLICNNHRRIGKEKNTQQNLIDYFYYLNYNLLFSQFNNNVYEIKNLGEFRQIIKYSGKDIIDKILKNQIKYSSKVLLDGAPAIGKSTIGEKQKKYKYISEFSYQPYTMLDNKNQLKSIIDRINILSNDNILVDTSFLMGITHLFYNEKTTKEYKKNALNQIISSINLNTYITKVIYLELTKDKLIERKNNDFLKERSHFDDNLKYLDNEIKFYKILDKELKEKSNIHFINADNKINDIIKKINEIENRPLLLVDLFLTIKILVEKGMI